MYYSSQLSNMVFPRTKPWSIKAVGIKLRILEGGCGGVSGAWGGVSAAETPPVLIGLETQFAVKKNMEEWSKKSKNVGIPVFHPKMSQEPIGSDTS